MEVIISIYKEYTFLLFILIMLIPNSHANAQNIVSHKALYDIKLISKKSGANISNISGKMFYEVKRSCDAWITSQRFDSLYEYPQLPLIRMSSDISTYESFDGREFNFTLQRRQDGVIFEEIRGKADINKVIYSIPKGLIYKLPKGTLFPVAHTIEVLKKIKNGEKLYNATIFDGSDIKGPLDINTIILSESSKHIDVESSNKNIDTKLLNNKSWNIRLAFFPLNSVETSDYEMAIIFHENGVISKMISNYDNFSVAYSLIALERLDEDCLDDIDNN